MNDNKNNIDLNEISCLYYEKIYSFCRRRLETDDIAYDITQNVFVQLVENHHNIRNQDVCSILGWLYKVAKNEIADYYRESYKEKQNRIDIEYIEDSLKASYNFTDELSEQELVKYQKQILSELNESENNLYQEFFINKMSYSEMSEKHMISEGALRTRISRIRRKIERTLKSVLYLLTDIFTFVLLFLYI